MIKVTFLGGADGIGASCAVVDMEEARVLVDCGQRLGSPPGEQLPDFSLLEDGPPIDAVLVTHAHADHIGCLPALVDHLPDDCPVYATAATIALARVMLDDSISIMYRHRAADGHVSMFPPSAVGRLFDRFEEVSWETRFTVPGTLLRAAWYPSGHILGAGMVELRGEEGTILFSGDLSIADQRTVPGALVPSLKADVLVMESTYGGRFHAHRPDQERRIVKRVREAIDAGGHVLFPTFALGRAQEVLLILGQAMRRGELPEIPVYADGLVRRISKVYSRFARELTPAVRKLAEAGLHPIFPEDLPIHGVKDDHQRESIARGRPSVVVASSGMLQGGASQFYARHWLDEPESLILITGYQDEESPGQALISLANRTPPEGEPDGPRYFNLGGVRTEVKCQVESFQLSAHADTDELVNFAGRVGAKDVVLVHGDPTAREALSRAILASSRSRVHLPLNGDQLAFKPPSGEERAEGRTRGRVRPQEFWPPWDPNEPGDLDLETLHRFVVSIEPAVTTMTVDDLVEVWKTPELITRKDRADIRRAVYAPDQIWFLPDQRRPYLLRPTPLANLKPAPPPPPMPVEQVTVLLRDAFPKSSGFRRAGFWPGEREVELVFAFPEAIRISAARTLADLTTRTGWTYLLRPGTDPDDLTRFAARLLDPHGHVEVAGEVTGDRFLVTGGPALDPADVAEFEERFLTRTGFRLDVSRLERRGAEPESIDR